MKERTRVWMLFLNATFISALILSFLVSTHVSAEKINDPILMVFSSRHMKMDIKKLEQLAGGEDPLVKRLLELRTDQTYPYVSVRAEKALLYYSEREEVKQVLLSDLQAPEKKGLARVIAIHLDRVTNQTLKEELAKLAIERASGDKDFIPYARAATSESSDPKLRALGEKLLQ